MFESYKKCNISIKEPFNDYSSSNLVPIDPVFSKNDIELNLKVVFHAKTYVSPYMLCFRNNYTLYKNPGFWLVNSRCIFRVFSYLGLISFIFTAARVLHENLTFFSLCRSICENVFTFLTLACIKPPNSFGIFLHYLYT